MYKIPTGTLFFGKNLLVLPECPSTNTLAAEMSQSGQAVEGTVVITHHQTSGRGQRGNTWESGKGLNLTFSLVLNPVFLRPIEQFELNQAVALAIRDVVAMYAASPVKVKWPNDIMIGDKKTCGVLIENQVSGEKWSRAIVGIGLNVNQTDFGSTLATSISADAGRSIDLPEIFELLLQALEAMYLKLRGGMYNPHFDYFKELYRLNEEHKFIVDGQEVDATIRGIDRSGKLLAEVEKDLKAFDLKEIKFVI